MKNILSAVIAAVEAEGEKLAEEFHLPQGPRGSRGNAPVDTEIEERLRAKLQKLLPATFIGEETGLAAGSEQGWTWLVDPQDGTSEFLAGRRGAAISVALLRGREPVLGVVHAPLPPDRGRDTIAWAEGARHIVRNGEPLTVSLEGRRLAAGEFVLATASSAQRPLTWSEAAMPARYLALPSIAYRMARVAAGDAVATVSTHAVNEYDIAAGMALVRAAGGAVLDGAGRAVALTGKADSRVGGVFAGAPQAAAKLAQFDFTQLDGEPRRPARLALGFPRPQLGAALARGQGCLLGQVIGDSLGGGVELMSAAEISRAHPAGVRELADGGRYKTLAGQPTDDSEMALTLCRSILQERGFFPEKVREAYRLWLQSRPVDVGATTERGLLGLHTNESESNGSLMRVSPLGVWAAGDPARAAAAARIDSALTHPNPVCVEACAGYVAAIAAGAGGADREAMLDAALAEAMGAAREAIQRGAAGAPPDFSGPASVLASLQNAFAKLFHSKSFEDALVSTVAGGGDTDTNAAITGALLGACHGREAIPARWILPVLACRPVAEAGALRPRPMEMWPDDVLEIAEALLNL